MRNKPRICIAVYHRGPLSLGTENHLKHGLAIFHWAILIKPKNSTSHCAIFDATDCFHQDPKTLEILNPDQEWWFRSRLDTDPLQDFKFLGGMVIGKLQRVVRVEELERKLEKVRLPRVGFRPAENCLSWARDAVEMMVKEGILTEIDWDEVSRVAVELGKKVIERSKKGDLADADRWRECNTKKAT